MNASFRQQPRWRYRQQTLSSGFSLAELLLVVALLGVSTILGWQQAAEILMRHKINAALHGLHMNLRLAATHAKQKGQPCALSLPASHESFSQAVQLSPCFTSFTFVDGELFDHGVQLTHNFPSALRFASNGLALDAGTAVVGMANSRYQRCLVMALPLGIIRLGRYEENQCIADL